MVSGLPFQPNLAPQTAQRFGKSAVEKSKSTLAAAKDTFSPRFNAAEKTLDDRHKATVEMAKGLFQPSMTGAEMAQAVQQALLAQGVKLTVFDGSQPGQAWVNEAVRQEGCEAFHHIPESLMFNRNLKNDWSNYAEPYRKALKSLQDNQSLGVFIPQNASRGVVMHELFHALQYANGLKSHAGNAEAYDKAVDFRNQLSNPLWKKSGYFPNAVNAVYNAFRRGMVTLIAAPVLWIQHQFRTWRGTYQPSPAGDALRAMMDREKEVCRFMMREGLSHGGSLKDVVSHAMYYAEECWLQTIRSYELDT